jgi:DNA-binding MarR family transcriptional regulator
MRSEREGSAREECAGAVRRAVTHLGRRLRAERPAGALNGTKLSVLSHLYRLGPSAPGMIAAAERHQPQSLSRTFAELQTAGLVSRRPREGDRRGAVLTITEAGRDALIRDMAYRDAWLRRALADFTDAEVELVRIAAELLARLAERPSGPPVTASEAFTAMGDEAATGDGGAGDDAAGDDAAGDDAAGDDAAGDDAAGDDAAGDDAAGGATGGATIGSAAAVAVAAADGAGRPA